MWVVFAAAADAAVTACAAAAAAAAVDWRTFLGWTPFLQGWHLQLMWGGSGAAAVAAVAVGAG